MSESAEKLARELPSQLRQWADEYEAICPDLDADNLRTAANLLDRYGANTQSTSAEKAAQNMDWDQVVVNGGPPCFYLREGLFCGRAQRWQGHYGASHDYVSLVDLLKKVGADSKREGMEKAAQLADEYARLGRSRIAAAIRRLKDATK